LIVRPLRSYQIGNLTTEPPQTIANRDKNELLGVYRRALKDVESRLEDAGRLLEYLQAHPPSHRRTGEAVIKVGVLNSGDSEGVVYPKALLRSSVGEIDLTAKENRQADAIDNPALGNVGGSGGYVVVPPRSFREATFVMDHSTRATRQKTGKSSFGPAQATT